MGCGSKMTNKITYQVSITNTVILSEWKEILKEYVGDGTVNEVSASINETASEKVLKYNISHTNLVLDETVIGDIIGLLL